MFDQRMEMEPQNTKHVQIVDIPGHVPDDGIGSSSLDSMERATVLTVDCTAEQEIPKIANNSDDVPPDEHATFRSIELKFSGTLLLLAAVFGVVIIFMDVCLGIFAKSSTILTVAAHLYADVATLAISVWAVSSWEAPPSESPYYRRFLRIEILGALLSIQLIWLFSGILVYESIVKTIDNTAEVNAVIMFPGGLVCLGGSVIMALLLDHITVEGQDGDFRHSDEMTISSTRNDRKRSLDHDAADQSRPLLDKLAKDRYEKIRQRCIKVLRALKDSVHAIAVLICAAFILYEPEWKVFDLICTLIFSVTLLWKTVKMLRNVLDVVMGRTPRAIHVKRT